MSNEKLDLLLVPLGEEIPHGLVERKLAGVSGGTGILNKDRVFSEQYIDKRSLEVNAFVLSQDVSVRIEPIDLDGRVMILSAIFGTVIPDLLSQAA